MTQAAVFGHGRVLPEKRTTLFRMTGVTGVIDCKPGQLRVQRIAVRTVAACAGHLCLSERMREGFLRLAALQLMAVKAHLSLRSLLQNRIRIRMAAVACCARDIVARVRTGMPAAADISIVARRAHGILLRDIGSGISTKADDCGSFRAAPYAPGMFGTRSMTGLALQLSMAKRTTSIPRHGMPAAKQRERYSVIVATDTGIGAVAAVIGSLLCQTGRRQQVSAQHQRGKRKIPVTAHRQVSPS